MAASGCTLLDSPHLLKHVKKKIVCLSFNCCQPFSLFVMHEFIYLLVFVSKRVETALRDKANLTEGDMVLSKERGFETILGRPKILRLLSRLYSLTVCLVLRHLICAMQGIGQMFVSRLFVCLLLLGLFFFLSCVFYKPDKQTKLETPLSRF